MAAPASKDQCLLGPYQLEAVGPGPHSCIFAPDDRLLPGEGVLHWLRSEVFFLGWRLTEQYEEDGRQKDHPALTFPSCAIWARSFSSRLSLLICTVGVTVSVPPRMPGRFSEMMQPQRQAQGLAHCSVDVRPASDPGTGRRAALHWRPLCLRDPKPHIFGWGSTPTWASVSPQWGPGEFLLGYMFHRL